MNNRLEINPLIEENMNQMVDGEIAINQINGHITIKKGEEFLSKTKKLNIELVDKNILKTDLNLKIVQEEQQLVTYKNNIVDIDNINSLIQNKLDTMLSDISIYENKCIAKEETLRSLDVSLKQKLQSSQIAINTAINSNIQLLGSLMIENELLDRISNSKTYYETYVKNTWKYPNSLDVLKDYGTVAQHNDNKLEMDKRINKSEYNSFIQEIKTKYANAGATYNVIGGI